MCRVCGKTGGQEVCLPCLQGIAAGTLHPTICTPYDGQAGGCSLRSVLDGEVWCDTHRCYGFRPSGWREWAQKRLKEV